MEREIYRKRFPNIAVHPLENAVVPTVNQWACWIQFLHHSFDFAVLMATCLVTLCTELIFVHRACVQSRVRLAQRYNRRSWPATRPTPKRSFLEKLYSIHYGLLQSFCVYNLRLLVCFVVATSWHFFWWRELIRNSFCSWPRLQIHHHAPRHVFSGARFREEPQRVSWPTRKLNRDLIRLFGSRETGKHGKSHEKLFGGG